jgi:hypothetical protein
MDTKLKWGNKMKKKLALLLATAILAVSLMAGCGITKITDTAQNPVSEETVSESTSSQSESSQPESQQAESVTTPENADSEYLSWTSTEYSAASDEEKTEAVIAFAVYTCQLMDMDYITEDLLRSTLEDESVKAQMETSKQQIESSLELIPNMTLKEIADMGVSVLQSGDDSSAEN